MNCIQFAAHCNISYIKITYSLNSTMKTSQNFKFTSSSHSCHRRFAYSRAAFYSPFNSQLKIKFAVVVAILMSHTWIFCSLWLYCSLSLIHHWFLLWICTLQISDFTIYIHFLWKYLNNINIWNQISSPVGSAFVNYGNACKLMRMKILETLWRLIHRYFVLFFVHFFLSFQL